MAVKAGGATAARRSRASGEGGEGAATRAAAERRRGRRRLRSGEGGGGAARSAAATIPAPIQWQEGGAMVESCGGTRGASGEGERGEDEDDDHAQDGLRSTAHAAHRSSEYVVTRLAGFDVSARTIAETILMARGDQWARPGMNREPAAEAGGGCLRLAPLPPRQMQRRTSQRIAQVAAAVRRQGW